MRLSKLMGSALVVAALGVAGCQGPVDANYPGQYGPAGAQNMPPVPNDPITLVDLTWLRLAAKGVLEELTAALPPDARARVQGIPLVTDSEPGDINAYAACDQQRQPRMGVTDGLLQVQAYIAQFKATDEVFGTHKLDEYLQAFVTYQKPHQPIVAPPPGFVDPAQSADFRKVYRQHVLMEEQLAFVMGHELAHHHLGHTGCAIGGRGPVSLLDLGRLVSKFTPIKAFNQLDEWNADRNGTYNLLAAGARRPGAHWNEEGAMLTLQFFARLEKLTTESLALSFFDTHPNPRLREPVVTRAAIDWRAGGGNEALPPPGR